MPEIRIKDVPEQTMSLIERWKKVLNQKTNSKTLVQIVEHSKQDLQKLEELHGKRVD